MKYALHKHMAVFNLVYSGEVSPKISTEGNEDRVEKKLQTFGRMFKVPREEILHVSSSILKVHAEIIMSKLSSTKTRELLVFINDQLS